MFMDMIECIDYTRQGGSTTSFDDYAEWGSFNTYGKSEVFKRYERADAVEAAGLLDLTDTEKKMVIDNVNQNVINTVKENPEVTFYMFFPPYNIVYWDVLTRNGSLKKEIDAQKLVIEMMLPYENIKLYSFCDNEELICNFDCYRDMHHYSPDISTQILYWMKEGTGLLTEDNYENYIDGIMQFYSKYDYDTLFTN